MGLRNARRNPVPPQSEQEEHAAEGGQQNDADKHCEGVFMKEASNLIQQVKEAPLRPHVCHCNHHYVFLCDSDRRPSVVTRPTDDHHKPLPRVGQPMAFQIDWAVCGLRKLSKRCNMPVSKRLSNYTTLQISVAFVKSTNRLGNLPLTAADHALGLAGDLGHHRVSEVLRHAFE